MQGSERPDPGLGDVLLLLTGVGGIAMCITLLYLGSTSVMDVGGFCAEGGPYAIEQHCPEGTIPATLLGTFGIFLFGGIGLVGGAKVGGYGWLLIAAWTALFAVLGWGFLRYGLFDPPEGEAIAWGFLIPGVIFQVMAWVPAVLLVTGRAGMDMDIGVAGGTVSRALPGPRQRARPDSGASAERDATADPDATAAIAKGAVTSVVDRPSPEEALELRAIASAMGAVITDAAAEIPADPERRRSAAAAEAGDGEAGFSEGTQALLDRLERLADMRDRGLLAADEYETAKDVIVRELEARA